jgi:hypothetical protein
LSRLRVFIGFDPRERDAYLVAERSLRKHASIAVEVEPLVLEQLRWKRLYNRTTLIKDGRLWDAISDAPMATEFALTRFLVPHLANWDGWALYCDCDFLFRADVAALLEAADPRMAAYVVKHPDYKPREGAKMDGQIQTAYPRKNWSSFILWNCAHDAHAGQLQRVNRWRGLRLHQFRWIPDDELGELRHGWNWLEGTSQLELRGTPVSPAAVHFTRGTPDMPGHENAAFADEWRATLAEASSVPLEGAVADA